MGRLVGEPHNNISVNCFTKNVAIIGMNMLY